MSAAEPPLVSIVVPCYNAEAWVAQAIESALGQTWPAREVIVVNDGSRDGSLAAARRFEPSGVRVLDQPNRGAAAARNAGLAAARGAYIQFLDADDLLAPDKLERQLERISSLGPRVLASGAWARFTREPAEASFEEQANWRDLTGIEFLQLHYEQICMMHPAAWLAPRELLDRAGRWDETLSLNDDGEYFARVMLAAERIVFCRDARSLYRSSLPQSLSGRRDPRALDSLYRSTELTLRHLLDADSSARSRAAAAFAWKWTAFEMYPDAPALARAAERRAGELGGSSRPFPAGGRFQLASRLLGWRLAKRLLLSR
ncbi:MAG TPA: glycosyltransferase family 2 protein [Opitutaceae bacterium]|nr:glycosyltransferase family 2 protein [Opitutaceae bacterium]